MPLSQLARTHLVYQSIILVLVLSTFHDLLPKIALFLFVLLYQILVLLWCCTETVPVPRWMSHRSDVAPGGDSIQEPSSNGSTIVVDEGSKKLNDEVPAMSKEPNNLDHGNQDVKLSARKYKLRNWKSPSTDASTLNRPVTVLSPEENNGICSARISSAQIKSPEPTKKYFFPYRQKRLEQWIEPIDNQRPYKIRNWQSNSNIGQLSVISSSNITDRTPPRNIPDSSMRNDCPLIPDGRYGLPTVQKPSAKSDDDGIGNPDDCLSIDSSVPDECPAIPELLKRYTFPFRQKLSIDSDNDELGHSDDFPATPYWKTVGYSLAVKQEARKRRRSVSSSLLGSRKFDPGQESDTFKDFSRSVEIPSTTCISDRKFNTPSTPSGSSTFAKIKLGFVNCFSKMKRVNSKNNLNKGLGSKKRSFKSLFQSRESINLENTYPSKSNIEIEEQKSDFYPSYIPFQKERFEKDVRKRMLELPQK